MTPDKPCPICGHPYGYDEYIERPGYDPIRQRDLVIGETTYAHSLSGAPPVQLLRCCIERRTLGESKVKAVRMTLGPYHSKPKD